jgi:hypothetical protein
MGLALQVLLICHSERSEESSRSFVAWERGADPTGFFAALRMTRKVGYDENVV